MTTQRFFNAHSRVAALQFDLDLVDEKLGWSLSGRATEHLLAKRRRLVRDLEAARAELEAARPAASEKVRAAAKEMM